MWWIAVGFTFLCLLLAVGAAAAPFVSINSKREDEDG